MTGTIQREDGTVIFQLTSSQGGWHILFRNRIVTHHSFQLTSSQGGWLLRPHTLARSLTFSTHILTRRMTGEQSMKTSELFFQLTSSQGGWQLKPSFIVIFLFFNSHPHKEDDNNTTRILCKFFFSTHILTRRMTLLHACQCYVLSLFNSHPHKEDDCTHHKTLLLLVTFQLTSSQGGWPTMR